MAGMNTIPVLRELNGRKVLYVDGYPFLILSLQLNCDSCYSPQTIDTLMEQAKRIGCNAVAPLLFWSLVEPREDEFDLSILEAMLQSARRYDLKLVLVWFGSNKNAYMHYVPDWVMSDAKRFIRVRRADGSAVNYVSCYNAAETLKKETEAIQQVFVYLRDHDTERNVILFQMNNETGIIGNTNRCYCDTCNERFESGRFAQKYGERAAEVFGAISNLEYQEHLAREGKSIYPIPCYLNAWLARPLPDYTPGFSYPAGGPVGNVMDIYAENKHYIDFVSPDIYTPGYRDFMRICNEYTFPGNPLYIAEHTLGLRSRAYKNVVYAFGEFAAIGVDPWAIDCAAPHETDPPLYDLATGRICDETCDMMESYLPIRDAMVPIALNMGTDRLRYWVQEESENEPVALDFGDVVVKVKYCDESSGQSRGMAIRTDKNTFIFAGCKCVFSFHQKDGRLIEMKDSCRGRFDKDKFIAERRNTMMWTAENRELTWLKECGVCMVELDMDSIRSHHILSTIPYHF